MKKITILLLVLVISLSSFSVLHKFYVSVTQVEYNEEQKSLQIISRIFIDDLEEALRKRYDESITLDAEITHSNVDEYIKRYLRQKLTIAVNGTDVSFNYIGKEYENDLILCYLEIENVPFLEEIKVSNQILIGIFEEQQNIVHIKKGKHRKSLFLEKEKEEGVLKFSE